MALINETRWDDESVIRLWVEDGELMGSTKRPRSEEQPASAALLERVRTSQLVLEVDEHGNYTRIATVQLRPGAQPVFVICSREVMRGRRLYLPGPVGFREFGGGYWRW